ncbi:DUF2281 domain-containing protein [Allochromatium humboldtianum]|uniref:DUF2281 domain-containing protein n=2 Tax=Allochromatium humboldtianum TaxID=504901 RepID=A0A850RB87_9GAMM|nr:DUF2281 domain-containing protein [Allochromatium humboldtianum]
MNSTARKLLNDFETLPPAMQQEVTHFVEYLKHKLTFPPTTSPHQEQEPNGAKVAQLMAKIAERGTAFREIDDPAAWQREIRKDRPLPGRE